MLTKLMYYSIPVFLFWQPPSPPTKGIDKTEAPKPDPVVSSRVITHKRIGCGREKWYRGLQVGGGNAGSITTYSKPTHSMVM